MVESTSPSEGAKPCLTQRTTQRMTQREKRDLRLQAETRALRLEAEQLRKETQRLDALTEAARSRRVLAAAEWEDARKRSAPGTPEHILEAG